MAPMTFRFENIGPVDHAEIALGDLTIVAGRNNTGKTYLVYALYGFLKHLQAWPFSDAVHAAPATDPDNPLSRLPLHLIAKTLAASGRASLPMTPKQLAEARHQTVDMFARGFSEMTLPTVFSSTSEAFEDARMSVDFDSGEVVSEPCTAGFPARSHRRISMHYDGQALVLATDIEHPAFHRISFHNLLANVRRCLFRFLCSDFPRPFIVSAERFGISLFYKELDFTKSQLVDFLQKLGSERDRSSRDPYLLIDKTTSRYAQPIKDNIDYTRSIYDLQKNKGPLANDKLFEDIKDIMGGYYKASRDVIAFRSKTRGKRRFDIPLHLASSSARGLTDLYFYLRHQAIKDDLLIIDEPESHLDTRNQIFLARMLARFVHAGIRVLITTHSDYVVKELNNLIMLSHIKQDDDTMNDLQYVTADCLKASSVRAYVAEKNQLLPAAVDEFGINMPTFDDTIDDINRTSRTLAAAVRATKS